MMPQFMDRYSTDYAPPFNCSPILQILLFVGSLHAAPPNGSFCHLYDLVSSFIRPLRAPEEDSLGSGPLQGLSPCQCSTRFMDYVPSSIHTAEGACVFPSYDTSSAPSTQVPTPTKTSESLGTKKKGRHAQGQAFAINS